MNVKERKKGEPIQPTATSTTAARNLAQEQLQCVYGLQACPNPTLTALEQPNPEQRDQMGLLQRIYCLNTNPRLASSQRRVFRQSSS